MTGILMDGKSPCSLVGQSDPQAFMAHWELNPSHFGDSFMLHYEVSIYVGFFQSTIA